MRHSILFYLMYIGHIACIVFAGIHAWQRIYPNSFGKALLFLLFWGVSYRLAFLLWGLFLAFIDSIFGD